MGAPSAPESTRQAAEPPASPSTGQVLLGLFIVINIAYLLTINVLGFIKDLGWMMDASEPSAKVVNRLALDLPRNEGHAQDAYRLARRWGDVTAQYQSWCLFAPGVSDIGAFADLEVRWDELPPDSPPAQGSRPPLLLLNTDSPADLSSYVRLGYSRFRKYENNIVVRIYRNQDDTDEQARNRWGRAIRASFHEQSDTMLAYLAWRWRQLREEDATLPLPAQVILRSRSFRIPPADRTPWMWEGPVSVPVARWRPESDVVECYDPSTQSFLK